LTMRTWDEAPANAHDLPSPVARPRGFEPLTFGSVDRPSCARKSCKPAGFCHVGCNLAATMISVAPRDRSSRCPRGSASNVQCGEAAHGFRDRPFWIREGVSRPNRRDHAGSRVDDPFQRARIVTQCAPKRPTLETRAERGHKRSTLAGASGKPSVGLEPTTPSLPSKARVVIVSPTGREDPRNLDMKDLMVPTGR
jgi:hypothetical protein